MPTRERTELIWRKSSYSNADNGNCVEVSASSGIMAVRDSNAPASGDLILPPSAWRALLAALR